MKSLIVGLLAGAFSLGSALADPAPKRGPDVDPWGGTIPFGVQPYQKPDTPLGTGPYKAVMAQDPSLPDHTLYYPAKMDAGGKLPVIVWGNGACLNAGNRFRYFLTELASHGFLVVAGGDIANSRYEVGPQEGAPASALPPGPPPAMARYADIKGRNTAEQMLATLDWVSKVNADPSSPFHDKLDPSRIGVAGQSCGGSLAAGLAGDPRIKTTALFSGSPPLKPGPNTPPGAPDVRDELGRIHGPILMLSGDAGDIAHNNTADDAALITQVPVFYAWQDGLAHIGTFGMPNGGELGRLGWQWFAWRLRGDQKAAATFKGPNCGLCKETADGWHVVKYVQN